MRPCKTCKHEPEWERRKVIHPLYMHREVGECKKTGGNVMKDEDPCDHWELGENND